MLQSHVFCIGNADCPSPQLSPLLQCDKREEQVQRRSQKLDNHWSAIISNKAELDKREVWLDKQERSFEAMTRAAAAQKRSLEAQEGECS